MPRFTAKFRGFWFPKNFLKYFLCGSKREVGIPRENPPPRTILTLRPSNFSLITLGVFLLKV